MTYLLEHHGDVADPFGHGTNPVAMGLMMPMTAGLVMPWRWGGVALMRRELYLQTGNWQYCGIATPGESTIKQFPGLSHGSDQAYQYAAVTLLGNGYVSTLCEPVRLDFDSGGNLIQPLMPMFPVHATAAVIAAGNIRVSWEYEPYGQGASPTDFQVFEGADPATVDYDTPLPVAAGIFAVAYYGGRRTYSLTAGPYANLSEHVFSVRARNSNGIAEQNTLTTAAKRARSTPPVSAAAPLAALVKPFARRP